MQHLCRPTRQPSSSLLLQHDDAILPTTDKAYRQVCDGRRNPNGSPYRATMFTQQVNTGALLRCWGPMEARQLRARC